jgi:hypothetical protein
MNMLTVDRVAPMRRAAGGRAVKTPHPIEAATSAVAFALAYAHERGDAASVRILHAVLSVLSAAPRHSEH